jgi:hypothetical protein
MASLLEVPDRAVADEALAWPDRAKAAVITDADTYATACGLLLGIKDLRKKIAETFDPHVRRAHEAHKALVKEKADAEAPLTQAEVILKGALTAYDREQERLRQEEQRRIDEAARREAERLALEQAAALEAEGHATGDAAMVAEAHAIIDAPIAPVPMAPAVKATPKVAGVALRKSWAFRIVNANLVPRQYHVIDESKIRGVVRSLGQAANIPGVEVYEETSVAAGRR